MTHPSTSPHAEQQTQTHGSETSFNWLIILLAIVAACLLALYFMNFNGAGVTKETLVHLATFSVACSTLS